MPIVFNVPDDPVELGLVSSFAHPGANATGVSFLFSDLVAKHLGLVHELLVKSPPNTRKYDRFVGEGEFGFCAPEPTG